MIGMGIMVIWTYQRMVVVWIIEMTLYSPYLYFIPQFAFVSQRTPHQMTIVADIRKGHFGKFTNTQD